MDLPAILKQAAAASPGPWSATRHDRPKVGQATSTIKSLAVKRCCSYQTVASTVQSPNRIPDAEFIAAARTNVPMLVTALKEAQRKLKVVREIRASLATTDTPIARSVIAMIDNFVLGESE